MLVLHRRLDLGEPNSRLLEVLRDRLLEPVHLDPDQLGLAEGGRHLLLDLVDRIGVDVGEVLADRSELGFDIGEAGVGLGDPVVQRDDRIVEAGTDSTDMGVDVGDALADLVVEPGLEPVHPFRDPFFTGIDAGTDDVGHLGLLARGGGRDLVDAHHDAGESLIEAARHVGGDPLEASIDGRGHRVDVVDHLAGLFVELADAAVERTHVGLDLVLTMFDLLEDRAGGRLDRRGDPGVGLVDDASETHVHLVVTLLRRRAEVGQTCFEKLLQLALVGHVRCL